MVEISNSEPRGISVIFTGQAIYPLSDKYTAQPVKRLRRNLCSQAHCRKRSTEHMLQIEMFATAY